MADDFGGGKTVVVRLVADAKNAADGLTDLKTRIDSLKESNRQLGIQMKAVAASAGFQSDEYKKLNQTFIENSAKIKDLGTQYKFAEKAFFSTAGSMEHLANETNKLTKQANSLSNTIPSEIAKRAELTKQIEANNTILKAYDATQGRHQRNVGNYTGSFNALNNSINQLSREAPAFANSMNTGFMAISNNIPQLTDAISQLRAQNEGLKAEGKPTVSILKSIAGAMFSWQTAISLGVTLLTVYGGKIATWVIGLFEANKAVTALNTTLNENLDIQAKLREARLGGIDDAQELLNIELVKSQALEQQLTLLERQYAVETDAEKQATKLKEIGAIRVEQEKQRFALIELIGKREAADANTQGERLTKLADYYQKQAAIENQKFFVTGGATVDEEGRAIKLLFLLEKEKETRLAYDKLMLEDEEATAKARLLRDKQGSEQELNDTIALIDTQLKLKKKGLDIEKADKAQYDLAEAEADRAKLDAKEKYYKAIEDFEKKMYYLSDVMHQKQLELDERQNEYNISHAAQLESQAAKEKAIDDEGYKYYTDSQKRFYDQKKLQAENDFINGLTTKDEYEKQILEIEIESIKNQLAIEKAAGKDTFDTEKRLADAQLGLTKDTEKKKADIKKQFHDLEIQAINTAGQIVKDQEQAKMDAEKQHDQVATDLLKNRLDKGVISEKQYQDEVNKIKHEADIRERNQALFNIAVDTITASIASLVTNGGLPVAIPFIVAGGALAAAAVLAQPLPVYGAGGLIEGYAHSQGGTNINAEGGEYIVNKRSTKDFLPLLQAINAGGFRVATPPPLPYGAAQTPRMPNSFRENDQLADKIADSLRANPPVVQVKTINQAQKTVKVLTARKTL